MKLTKKLIGTGAISIAVVAVAVIAVIGAVKASNSSGKRTVITTSSLKEVIQISELSTGEFCYNGIVSIPKKDNENKTEYSAKYDSTVKAGIDAKDIDFVIDHDNKTVNPVLPDISIIDVLIDEKSISTIPENATAKLKETLTACKEDALKEARESKELVEIAKSNLQNTITALLTPVLKESGYDIVW